MTMLILALGAMMAGYFGIGRIVCPHTERLPLAELDADALAATVKRGWHAAGHCSPLSRITAHLHREYR